MVKGYGKGKFKSDKQRKAVMSKIGKPKKKRSEWEEAIYKDMVTEFKTKGATTKQAELFAERRLKLLKRNGNNRKRYKVIKIKENDYAIEDKKRKKVFVGFSKKDINTFKKSSTKERNELMDVLYALTL